jgi:hypothetical protein
MFVSIFVILFFFINKRVEFLVGKEAFRKYMPEHRVHRVAIATFWRTSHHYDKISPAW